MANPTYYSGITSTAQINANELDTTGWSVDASAAVLRYINSKTGTHPVKQATFTDATFSINVDYNTANSPFASPYSIVPGQALTNVKLNIDGAGGTVYWSFPAAIIVRVGESVVRSDKITTTIYCEASGSFVTPGGVTV